jgi:prepilin-type N-terminal cleavage/methylation domain-containing protein
MKRLGFTLIELLIVVAIIAILAAIAVPNFLEAQARSKVSRTKADMRTVAVAIESYHTDHNRYVYVNQTPGYGLPPGGRASFDGRLVVLAGMTTPIAYLTSLMLDPFGGRGQSNDAYMAFNTTKEYWYWTQDYMSSRSWGGPTAWTNAGPGSESNCQWALMSKGTDQVWSHVGAPQGTQEVDKPQKWQYDATNGTISWGNIVRVGP